MGVLSFSSVCHAVETPLETFPESEESLEQIIRGMQSEAFVRDEKDNSYALQGTRHAQRCQHASMTEPFQTFAHPEKYATTGGPRLRKSRLEFFTSDAVRLVYPENGR